MTQNVINEITDLILNSDEIKSVNIDGVTIDKNKLNVFIDDGVLYFI